MILPRTQFLLERSRRSFLKTEYYKAKQELNALDTEEARKMFRKEKLELKAELESVRSLDFILGKPTEILAAFAFM